MSTFVVYGWDGLHRFDASADVEAADHEEAATTFMSVYPFNPRHWKPHQLKVERPDGSDLRIFDVRSRDPLLIEPAP